MDKEKVKLLLEEAIAEVDHMTTKQSQNVLGDKWRYINAMTEKLMPEVEKILKAGDDILEFARHGDYSNGNEFSGMDEGDVLSSRCLEDLDKVWQDVKQREVK